MVRFYWSLGEDIVNRQMEKKYGAGIMETISRDLQEQFPDVKVLSRRNTFYTKWFYLIYYQPVKKCHKLWHNLTGNRLTHPDQAASSNLF